MSNMSYCRFQNTLPDLRDCYETMAEREPGEMSSFEEQLARWHLVRLCQRIMNDFGDEAATERPKRQKAES